MKNHLPYNILLVLAVLTLGFSVLYNTVLREQFAMTMRYSLPVPEVSESSDEVSLRYSEEDTQPEESWLYDDYYEKDKEYVVVVTFPLDANRASVDELMYIPRVGSAMAQRIVQYREVLGGFTDLLQLKEIKGIGDKTFEIISPYLYIEGEWPQSSGEPEEGEEEQTLPEQEES